MPGIVRDALIALCVAVIYMLIHWLRRVDKRRAQALEDELAEANARISDLKAQEDDHDFLVAEAQRLVDRVMKLENRQEERHDRLNLMQMRISALEVQFAFCDAHRRILTEALDRANKMLIADNFQPILVDLPRVPDASDDPPTKPLRDK